MGPTGQPWSVAAGWSPAAALYPQPGAWHYFPPLNSTWVTGKGARRSLRMYMTVWRTGRREQDQESHLSFGGHCCVPGLVSGFTPQALSLNAFSSHEVGVTVLILCGY